MLVSRRHGEITALRDIPCHLARPLRVGIVGTSLTIDADAPQSRCDNVDDQCQQWDPHVHDE